MGKEARARVLADNQAIAIARNIRVSPRKLNLVAQQIRGKKVDRALNVLTFSQKRIASVVKGVISPIPFPLSRNSCSNEAMNFNPVSRSKSASAFSMKPLRQQSQLLPSGILASQRKK